MSAMPCGCDREAAWMCKRHLEESLTLRNERAVNQAQAARINAAWCAAETVHAKAGSVASALDRFKQRLSDADTMRDMTPAVDTPAVRMVNAAVDLLAERQRIAAVLATFYRAELSMSSVQPLLALALELNPDLVELTR